jgi:hypothetical protein
MEQDNNYLFKRINYFTIELMIYYDRSEIHGITFITFKTMAFQRL